MAFGGRNEKFNKASFFCWLNVYSPLHCRPLHSAKLQKMSKNGISFLNMVNSGSTVCQNTHLKAYYLVSCWMLQQLRYNSWPYSWNSAFFHNLVDKTSIYSAFVIWKITNVSNFVSCLRQCNFITYLWKLRQLK